jgi:hypothetical protein
MVQPSQLHDREQPPCANRSSPFWPSPPLACATPALAENAKGFTDETRDNGQINLRYPGDKGYQFGTTQRGPNGEEQPYVEKCFWTADNGWFGGFTQTCQRHTLENTSDQ